SHPSAMSSGTYSMPTTPSPDEIARSKSQTKFRLNLREIQNLTEQGRVRLSPGEINLFQSRGFLEQSTATKALTGIKDRTTSSPSANESSETTTAVLSASSSGQTLESVAHEIQPTFSSKTPRALPRATSRPSNTNLLRYQERRNRMVIQPSKQVVQPFHSQVFEDTCSHLHPSEQESSMDEAANAILDLSTTFRRHSESSVRMATRPRKTSYGGMMTSLAPMDASSARRSSMAAIPSPVRLAASQAMSRITELDEFKFPANIDADSSSTSTKEEDGAVDFVERQSGDMSLSAGARSKRKRAPIRSPSWADKEEMSPGVIFQIPFGMPASKRSMSLSTPDGGLLAATPLSGYPSPASSTRNSGSGASDAGGDTQSFESTMTPASPINHSGLGIQVKREFMESGSTHPLDFPAESKSSTQQDQDNSVDQLSINMPTPPMSTLVPPAAKKGSIQSPQPGPTACLYEDPSPASFSASGLDKKGHADGAPGSLPTPFTPSKGFEARPDKDRAPSQDGTTPAMAPEELTTILAPRSHSPGTEGLKDPLSSWDILTRTSTLAPLAEERQLPAAVSSMEEDRSNPNLLISAQEPDHQPLSILTGSGILPLPSKHLKLPGAATILSYPVLLSDVVRVHLGDVQADVEVQSEVEDIDMTSEHVLAAEVSSSPHQGGKRKRAYSGKKRGSISGHSTATLEHEDDPMDGRIRTAHAHKKHRSSFSLEATDNRAEVGSYLERSAHQRNGKASRHGTHRGRVSSFSPSPSPHDELVNCRSDQDRSSSHSRPSGLGSPVDLPMASFGSHTSRRLSKDAGGRRPSYTTMKPIREEHEGGNASERPLYDKDDDDYVESDGAEYMTRRRAHPDQDDVVMESKVRHGRPMDSALNKKGKQISGKGHAKRGHVTGVVDYQEGESSHPLHRKSKSSRGEVIKNLSDGLHPNEVDVSMKYARDVRDRASGQRSHRANPLPSHLDAIPSENEYDSENMEGRSSKLMRHSSRRLSTDNEPHNNMSTLSKKSKKESKLKGGDTLGGANPNHSHGNPTGKKKKNAAKSTLEMVTDPTTTDSITADLSLATASVLMQMSKGSMDQDDTEDEVLVKKHHRRHDTGSVNNHHNDYEEDTTINHGGNEHSGFARRTKEHVRGTNSTGMAKVPKQKNIKKLVAGTVSKDSKESKESKEPKEPKEQHRRRRSVSAGPPKHCEACGARQTPCWRPGYIENTHLCNSCGL
ncbi:hypothetical protein BGW38_003172, partial [Lunasporangiospora selenospora]